MNGKLRKVTPFQGTGKCVLEVEMDMSQYMSAAGMIFREVQVGPPAEGDVVDRAAILNHIGNAIMVLEDAHAALDLGVYGPPEEPAPGDKHQPGLFDANDGLGDV